MMKSSKESILHNAVPLRICSQRAEHPQVSLVAIASRGVWIRATKFVNLAQLGSPTGPLKKWLLRMIGNVKEQHTMSFNYVVYQKSFHNAEGDRKQEIK